MTVSALAVGRLPLAKTASGHDRFYRRTGKPQGVILHHAATTSDSALAGAFVSPRRELSANYAMLRNGDLMAVLHEEYRAFTSASPKADSWGITIEVVNSSGAPGWHISERSFDMLARWLADLSQRWGFPLNRHTVIGHREVLARFGQGYATACPGGIWPRMDELIALANRYRSGASGQPAPAKPPTPAKPSTPAPAKPKGAALLEGHGVGDSVNVSRWYAYSNAALTSGKRLVSGTYRIIGVTYRHRGGEPVLHVQDPHGRKTWMHYSAIDGVIKGAPAKPAPKPAPKPAGKSVAQMAAEVLAGKHGNGHANRQRSLAVNAATYAKVRAEVNRRV
ncbi:N-acetylmuramoyl-L-alanine amidase [Agrococcus sp. SL85]|uniref:N-acetylmuramoyl-L-alanine amidase n=1 Tax=Agrococcus sp. SL85 TaxID=2995141 RepID=UPI00226C9508|nr:N-acetylmuramoyl-L-alanine amidase [Agrococcus sp. SL85]WAC65194.1 N-acetylmuramoyl-L-alanine amidase [Agrococcus sp. SL85]